MCWNVQSESLQARIWIEIRIVRKQLKGVLGISRLGLSGLASLRADRTIPEKLAEEIWEQSEHMVEQMRVILKDLEQSGRQGPRRWSELPATEVVCVQ